MRQFLVGTPCRASLSLCCFHHPPGDYPDAVVHDLDPFDFPAEAANREVLGVRKPHLKTNGGQKLLLRNVAHQAAVSLPSLVALLAGPNLVGLLVVRPAGAPDRPAGHHRTTVAAENPSM